MSSDNLSEPAVSGEVEDKTKNTSNPFLNNPDPEHNNRFNNIYFGIRRGTMRYENIKLTQHHIEIEEPEDEKEGELGKQMRFQIVIAATVILLFIVAFAVIIALMLSKESNVSFLQFEPNNINGGSKIYFQRGQAVENLVDRISLELNDYHLQNWYFKTLNSGYQVVDCDKESRYPGPKAICKPQMDSFGPCNRYDSFGYLQGSPCLLLKPGGALRKNYTENVLVECLVKEPFNETVTIEYYPYMSFQNRHYTYFSRYFFPYQNNEFYHPPLAMVRLVDPPKNRQFTLICSLANPIFKNETDARISVDYFIS